MGAAGLIRSEHLVQRDYVGPQERGGILLVGIIGFPFAGHFDVQGAQHPLGLLLRIAAMKLTEEVQKIFVRQGFFQGFPVPEKMMGIMFQNLPAAVGGDSREFEP